MGVALVLTFCTIAVVAVARQAPVVQPQVARGAYGHEAAAVADPGCDLAFCIVVDIVPTSGQHHHVVGIPIEPVQAAHGRHRVVPHLLEGEPHFPKAQRRHVVAHHHGHARCRNVGHVVCAQIGSLVDHAAFKASHLQSGHAGGQFGQPCRHPVPKRFVVASRDHHRPAWVGCPICDDRPLGDPYGDAVLKQTRQHGRAQVGVVVQDVGIGRAFAVDAHGLQRRRPLRRGRHRSGQCICLKAVCVRKGPRGDVVGQAVAQFRVRVHQDLKQAGVGLPGVNHQVAFVHGDPGFLHRTVIKAAGFHAGRCLSVSDLVGVEQVGEPSQFGGIV